jgi:hypothetical protein
MDWSAALIALAWTALTLTFLYGWLRSGNGHWRWKWLQHLTHRISVTEEVNANAPIYGLIALACACSAVLYTILTFTRIAPSAAAMFLSRGLGQAPLILTFIAVAIIRRPWSGE